MVWVGLGWVGAKGICSGFSPFLLSSFCLSVMAGWLAGWLGELGDLEMGEWRLGGCLIFLFFLFSDGFVGGWEVGMNEMRALGGSILSHPIPSHHVMVVVVVVVLIFWCFCREHGRGRGQRD